MLKNRGQCETRIKLDRKRAIKLLAEKVSKLNPTEVRARLLIGLEEYCDKTKLFVRIFLDGNTVLIEAGVSGQLVQSYRLHHSILNWVSR